jgi:hypothetical protein
MRSHVAEVRSLLAADLRRPWKLWSKICVVTCASSLAFLMASGFIFRSTEYSWLGLVALCIVPASLTLSLASLRQKGTCKTIPSLAMVLICGLGWPFVLMSLVETPYLIFGEVLMHPSMVWISLVAIGVVLLILRIRSWRGGSQL